MDFLTIILKGLLTVEDFLYNNFEIPFEGHGIFQGNFKIFIQGHGLFNNNTDISFEEH